MVDLIKYTRCKQAANYQGFIVPPGWSPYHPNSFPDIDFSQKEQAVANGEGGFFSKLFKGKGGKYALYGGLGLAGVGGLWALMRSKAKKKEQQQAMYGRMY